MDDEIRRKILTLLDQHRIMTIATVRPDGWPQATTVGYVNEGLTLYSLCGLNSQKAANLTRDDRVSLTIDHDTSQVMEITGLSMAAHAQAVVNPAEADKVLWILPLKYPHQVSLPGPIPTADLRIWLSLASSWRAGYTSKLGLVGEEVSIGVLGNREETQ
jgi:general stress protein 26